MFHYLFMFNAASIWKRQQFCIQISFKFLELHMEKRPPGLQVSQIDYSTNKLMSWLFSFTNYLHHFKMQHFVCRLWCLYKLFHVPEAISFVVVNNLWNNVGTLCSLLSYVKLELIDVCNYSTSSWWSHEF